MYLWTTNVGRKSNGTIVVDPTPEGYAFATLGPQSLIAEVEISGDRLGPGGVVDLDDGPNKIVGVRPLLADYAGNTLQLALWRAGETPTPAPRPVVRDVFTAAGYTSAGYTRILSVPFDGRERAALRITANGAFDYVVEFRSAFAGGEHVAEYRAATFTPGTATGSAKATSLWINIGGNGDLGERGDVIDVFYRQAAARSLTAELEGF